MFMSTKPPGYWYGQNHTEVWAEASEEACMEKVRTEVWAETCQ